MKLKKLFAALTAGVMAATSISLSASAGNIVLEQTTTQNYSISIVATFGAASHTYAQGENMYVNYVTGSTATLTDANGKTLAVKLSDVYFNDAYLTNTQISFNYMTSENTLPAMSISNFTWKATATLTSYAATVDPSSLIDLSTAKFQAPLSITFPGNTAAIAVSDSSIKFTSAVDSVTNSLSMPISRYNFNNGNGLSIAEQSALMKATSNLTVTVNFTEAATTTAFYSLYTDLIPTAPVTAIVSPNMQSASFSVSPSFFYNASYMKLFSYIYITNYSSATTNNIKSVIITYPDDTTSTATNTTTSTTTTTVTNDESAAIDEDSDEDLTINYSTISLNVGQKFQLETSVPVTWKTSSKSTVVVYTNGKVKPVKAGTAVITGTTAKGNTVTCRVTGVNSANPTTEFDLTNSKGVVRIGKKYTLKYTCDPSDTTDKITWTSSDTSIVTVSSTGKITPKAVGTATITATTSSGLSDTCVLTVKTQS